MSEENNINVLIIDDETEFLSAMAKAIERRGFKVSKAENASAGLAAIKQNKIDVAVIDVRLPDMDGHDLFVEIKKRYPDVQGIILTGNRDENKSFGLSHKGLFEYLDKPIEPDQLAKVILDAYRQNHEDKSPVADKTAQSDSEDEPIRVLLIDDEQDFLFSLARILKRRGMIVHQAANGEEGLQVAEKENLDVAVIDLKMPGLGGMETLERLKKKKPEIEAIILTGHATVESGVEGMKKGAADYLFKPQEPEALVRKIQFAADKSRTSSKKRKWWRLGKN